MPDTVVTAAQSGDIRVAAFFCAASGPERRGGLVMFAMPALNGPQDVTASPAAVAEAAVAEAALSTYPS